MATEAGVDQEVLSMPRLLEFDQEDARREIIYVDGAQRHDAVGQLMRDDLCELVPDSNQSELYSRHTFMSSDENLCFMIFVFQGECDTSLRTF